MDQTDKPQPMCAGFTGDAQVPVTLQQEIRAAINRMGAENGSNTPDFILAKLLTQCLDAFNQASMAREKWYGANLSINGGVLAEVRRLKAQIADGDKTMAAAHDLLLERARQADELLRERDEAKAALLEIGEQGTELGLVWCVLTAKEGLKDRDLLLHRARLEVVEASLAVDPIQNELSALFKATNFDDPASTAVFNDCEKRMDAAWERWGQALDALQAITTPTPQANENEKTGQEKGERS
jgi:hypothetical protein